LISRSTHPHKRTKRTQTHARTRARAHTQGITEDVIKMEARKFGDVLRVKFDKRTPTSAWVTFADKKVDERERERRK